MKHYNSIRYTGLLVIMLILLTSCQWGKKRPLPKGKNIICVVDFSDSRNVSSRLNFYGNVVKDNIIPRLGIHDKITVIPIDKASLTNSTDILLKDLSSMDFMPVQANPMEEQQITENNLKKYKETLSQDFAISYKKAIDSRSQVNHATDIFGALEVVKGKLKPSDDNYIILLSDMMNYSSILNMEPNNAEFNGAALENILGNVPNYNMPNTTALVITGEQVEVTPAHFSLVQSFWMKYFNKNNIKLYDYNSGSVAKLNELMSLEITK